MELACLRATATYVEAFNDVTATASEAYEEITENAAQAYQSGAAAVDAATAALTAVYDIDADIQVRSFFAAATHKYFLY